MANNKIHDKIKYAIRMIEWHTTLANKHYDYINKYLVKNISNCKKELVKSDLKTEEIENNQTTIYDFIERESHE